MIVVRKLYTNTKEESSKKGSEIKGGAIAALGIGAGLGDVGGEWFFRKKPDMRKSIKSGALTATPFIALGIGKHYYDKHKNIEKTKSK